MFNYPFLETFSSPQGNTPLLILDCNQEFESDERRSKEMMTKVEEFVDSLRVTRYNTECEDDAAVAHS